LLLFFIYFKNAHEHPKEEMVLMSADSRVYRFVKDNNFFVKSKHEPRTHVSQDGAMGGKLNVNSARMDEFLACVALDIDNGESLYLNEQLTPVFRFFLDLDMNKTMKEMDAELLDLIIRVVYTTMQRLYPMLTHNIAVLTRSGSANAHVVFTDLLVDAQIAVFLCKAIHRAFMEEFGETQPWYNKQCLSDTLDSKPYGNTLRMAGSSKCTRCKTCAKAGDNCVDCSGSGHIHIGLEYRVSHAYVAGQRSHALLGDITMSTYTMLKSVTLRCDAEEPNADPDREAQKEEILALVEAGYYNEETDEIDKTLHSRQQQKKKRPAQQHSSSSSSSSSSNTLDATIGKVGTVGKVGVGAGEEAASAGKGGKRKRKNKNEREVVWTDVPKNSHEQIWAALHVAISYSHSMYAGTRITSVAMNYPSRPTMFSVRTDTTKCLNLATDSKAHNSEKTSFHVFANSRKIVAACGCKCDTTENRLNGVCSKWKPPFTPLSESIAKQLFPHNSALPTISRAMNDQINATGQYYASMERARVTRAESIERDGVVFKARKPSMYSFVSKSCVQEDKARDKQKKLEEDTRKLKSFNAIMQRLRAIINTHEVQRHRPAYTLEEVEPRDKGKDRAAGQGWKNDEENQENYGIFGQNQDN
jgi:hypothetical protein